MCRCSVIVSLLSFYLVFSAGVLSAQPNLDFKRASVHWPTIELFFSVDCNGAPLYNISQQDLKVLENGVEVTNFTLMCPDPAFRCAISVALVFDASGSMAGAGNAGAKLGGHAFVDRMDGMVDEAAIIFFSSSVSTQQQMTTIKPMLHAAVDALPVTGATAVWDGIYAGLLELINYGVNQCRSVIVMTDGGDNSSGRTVAEIISLADRHRIRVYTIGLGTGINTVELELIAMLTGGRFYQTQSASEIPAIYSGIYDLITIINAGECRITYERDCADYGLRTVELQLANTCGGSDTKTKNYRAPLDSATFSNLQFKLEDSWSVGGGQITMPLNLLTPMNGENFYPFSFTVKYDTACLHAMSIATPPGSLLAGLPITVTPVSDGVNIAVTDRGVIQGTGKMLELTFRTPAVTDTTCCVVEVVDAVFSQGCFIPVVAPGNVCFYPPLGEVWTCDIALPTITVDTARESYAPMPFDVVVTATNIGGLAIDSLTAEISFPPDLSFAAPDNPGSASKPLSPTALDAGQSGIVSWRLTHPVSLVPRDYTIRVIVRTPSDSSVCQSLFHIPALTLPPFSFDVTPEGPTAFCEGQSVTLDAGAGYVSYRWNTGEQSQRITVNQSGDYVCTVQRSSGRTGISRTVRVVVTPAPHPVLNVTGPIPFCEGDIIRLDLPGSFAKYLWSTGDTTSSLLVTTGGIYWAIVHTADNCIGYSDTLMVSTFQLPVKPTVSRAGDVLLSSSADNYQWLRDGVAMIGETNQFLQLPGTGSYRVRITNTLGCSNISDEYIVNILDVTALPAVVRSFDVYPDPTAAGVTLDLRLERAETVEIIVSNALGQELARLGSGSPVREFSRHITLGPTPGAYFLRITAGSESWVRRVVKTK
ncbi:MAG: VWA domain-containing protein [Bacteroidota bacterium]